MRYLFILLLFCSCERIIGNQYPKITQRLEDCEHRGWRVWTFVHVGRMEIVYTSDTWSDNKYMCLRVDQLDSTRKAEYKKAEEWLKVYEQIK